MCIRDRSHNGVEVDLARSVASAQGASVELTKNELRILTLLINLSLIHI